MVANPIDDSDKIKRSALMKESMRINAAERVARMEGQVENIDRDLRSHLNSCEEAHKEIQGRFSKIERIIWQSSGAVAAVIGIVQVIVSRAH
jgi:predicted  nucleic acid-binding Zn-ribbon protein